MANSKFVVQDGMTVGSTVIHPQGDIVTTGKIKVSHIEFPDLTTQSTASTGGGGGTSTGLQPITVKNVSGTSYTVVPEDINSVMVRMEVPLNQTGTVTIPDETSLPCAVGSTLIVASAGIGIITITGAAGVLVRSPQSKTIDRKYGRIQVVKTDTNQWEIDGQLVNQQQFFMLPFSASVISHLVLIAEEPCSPSTPVVVNITPYGLAVASLSQSLNSPNLSSSYIDHRSSTGTVTFGTAEPLDLYFRATLLSGDLPLRTTPNYYTYWDYGQWAQYKASTPEDPNRIHNPRWESSGLTIGTATPGDPFAQIRIDVSETPGEAGIIGSFSVEFNSLYQFWVNNPMTTGVFINTEYGQSTSTQFNFSANGVAIDLSTQETLFQLLANNSQTQMLDYGPSDSATFVRFSIPDGLPSGAEVYTLGDVLLDEIYPMSKLSEDYNNGSFGFTGVDGQTVTYLIEILTTLNGPQRVISSGKITLGLNAVLANVPPIMNSIPSQDITLGASYLLKLPKFVTGTDGDPILSYDIVTGILPDGLLFNSTTGIISGKATTEATVGITVTATDKDGISNETPIQFVVTQRVPVWVYNPARYPIEDNPQLATLSATEAGNTISFSLSDYIESGDPITEYALDPNNSNSVSGGVTVDPLSGAVNIVTTQLDYQSIRLYFTATNSAGISESAYIDQPMIPVPTEVPVMNPSVSSQMLTNVGGLVYRYLPGYLTNTAQSSPVTYSFVPLLSSVSAFPAGMMWNGPYYIWVQPTSAFNETFAFKASNPLGDSEVFYINIVATA